MANKDMGRKSQGSSRDALDWDDRDRDQVRGRADEMEDASEGDEFEDFQIRADNCSGRTIEVSESCSISLRFDPRTEGLARAEVGGQAVDAHDRECESKQGEGP